MDIAADERKCRCNNSNGYERQPRERGRSNRAEKPLRLGLRGEATQLFACNYHRMPSCGSTGAGNSLSASICRRLASVFLSFLLLTCPLTKTVTRSRYMCIASASLRGKLHERQSAKVML